MFTKPETRSWTGWWRLKVLKPEFREDANFIVKFRKEAQAAAGLAHPNVVNVFDVGEDRGLYYIVMELVEGITLKAYITRKGKLSVKESTSIAIQVSLGLEAAHNRGIVHRDVKPQNIIISTDGKVKLSDFELPRPRIPIQLQPMSWVLSITAPRSRSAAALLMQEVISIHWELPCTRW